MAFLWNSSTHEVDNAAIPSEQHLEDSEPWAGSLMPDEEYHEATWLPGSHLLDDPENRPFNFDPELNDPAILVNPARAQEASFEQCLPSSDHINLAENPPQFLPYKEDSPPTVVNEPISLAADDLGASSQVFRIPSKLETWVPALPGFNVIPEYNVIPDGTKILGYSTPALESHTSTVHRQSTDVLQPLNTHKQGKKRRRCFDPVKKEKVKQVRRLRACLRCKLYKEPVRPILRSIRQEADSSVRPEHALRKMLDDECKCENVQATLLPRTSRQRCTI
jgi:hypothetical protein